MKFLILAVLLAVVSADPIVKIGSITDCGGGALPARISGTVNTDPVRVPGTMELTWVMAMNQAWNDNTWLMQKTVTRLSDNVVLPCYDGQWDGSCGLPVCGAIQQSPLVCAIIQTASLSCSCPVPSGTHTFTVTRDFTSANWGPGTSNVGNFNTRVEFKMGPSSSAPLFACADVRFTIA